MIQLQKFRTLVDLLTYFENEQICRDYLEVIRWDGDLKCPYKDCEGGKVHKFADGKRYKCSTTLPYKKLIEDGKKEITFNIEPVDRQAQYQQGTFGF